MKRLEPNVVSEHIFFQGTGIQLEIGWIGRLCVPCGGDRALRLRFNKLVQD